MSCPDHYQCIHHTHCMGYFCNRNCQVTMECHVLQIRGGFTRISKIELSNHHAGRFSGDVEITLNANNSFQINDTICITLPYFDHRSADLMGKGTALQNTDGDANSSSKENFPLCLRTMELLFDHSTRALFESSALWDEAQYTLTVKVRQVISCVHTSLNLNICSSFFRMISRMVTHLKNKRSTYLK